MIKASEDALTEMCELKDQVIVQNKAFMANLEEINGNLIADSKDMRHQQNIQMQFISDLKKSSQDHQGDIDALFSRMDKAEDKINEIEKMAVDLGIMKCDKIEFQENL